MTRRWCWGLAVLAGVLWLVTTQLGAQEFLGRTLREWEGELRNGKAPARRSAAFALGRMGAVAAEALDSLVSRAQSDPDASVREMCGLASGRIIRDLARGGSPLATGHLTKLREVLRKDTDARVRRAAAVALGAFGSLGHAAVPELTGALTDKDSSVRQNAARALGDIRAKVGPDAVAAMTRLLSDGDVLVRRDSAFALGQLGKVAGKTTVRPLLTMVRSEKDEVVRKTALDALSQVVGPESREFAPDLYPLLESRDPDTVRAAALVLGNMGGEPAEKAIPALRKLLESPKVIDQALSAAALANLKDLAAPAVPELANALRKSRDPIVRRNIAIALYNVGERAAPAVSALASALDKKMKAATGGGEAGKADDDARVFMADALGKIRYPAIKEALPALSTIISDKGDSSNVRHKAVWAMRTLGPDGLRDHKVDVLLTKVLDDRTVSNPLVRYDAARVLAFGLRADAPEKTISTLIEMMQDDKLVVFRGAGAKVKGLGSESKGGASTTSVDQGGDARYMAIAPLLEIGPRATGSVPVQAALRRASTDRSKILSDTATKAMTDLGIK